MSGNGNWGMFRPRASEFYTAETFCFGGVKFTKEPSKGRGISISLSPLKSSLLKTTNLVLASSRSLALPGGARLVSFAARPLPMKAASLGFHWGPISAAPLLDVPPGGRTRAGFSCGPIFRPPVRPPFFVGAHSVRPRAADSRPYKRPRPGRRTSVGWHDNPPPSRFSVLP